MERHHMFVDWKTQCYDAGVYPHQNPNGSLCRNRE